MLCILLRFVLMFQFTHPVWGATPVTSDSTTSRQFQFTHPVWGATKVE